MSKNISATLLDFPNKEHVNKICRPRKKSVTCRYLSMSPDGWTCLKNSDFRIYIKEKSAKNDNVARGNNCEGIIKVILENQKELIDKKIDWQENVYHKSGLLKKIDICNGVLHILAFWEKERGRRICFNLPNLSIRVSPDTIMFGIIGKGIFAGEATISLK